MMATVNNASPFEDFAISKYPKRGRCPQSCFADGAHRVGKIPVLSLLDGAASGDVLGEICLECGMVFGHNGFVPKRQPNRVGGTSRPARASRAHRQEPVDKYYPELLSANQVAEFELMFAGGAA
jgi:hypothetical protein